ncbi:hypothetical protein KAV46_00800 [Candidatus Bathyarchaeota archaeon]|nr:hypothetical protein [Candidatus Bathyarchaeota archaeon]
MISMNWVLIVGGLIPFCMALLIIFMNRGAAKPRSNYRDISDYESNYDAEYDDDYNEAPQPSSRLGFLKKINLGFLSGLRGRLPGRKKPEAPEPQATSQGVAQDMYDEVDELQPQAAPVGGLAGPDLTEERRLWGKTLLIFTGTGFVNGLYIVLDYVFTTYKKSLGMKMPLATELRLVSNLTLLALGLSVLYAALKTGLKLAKS